MAASVDLDAYFNRIRWGNGVRANLETLQGILNAHMLSIPFENLDVLLGKPIRLDLEGIQKKLIQARRGGYCFEHMTLFAAMLEQIGFQPIRHTARVVLLAPRNASPRTHMFLTVPLPEGTYVVDAGFGALAPRVPVPLIEGMEVRVNSDAHRMIRDGHHWILQAQTGDKMTDAWVSTLEEDNMIDFEVGNHFTSTHQNSPFRSRIMMRALTDEGRITVMNRDVTIRHGAESRQMTLADRQALRELLVQCFGFDLPEAEHIRVPSIPEWS